jgi:dTDP-4-amino-4,6-dideoxygalactose transaminase
VTAWGTAAELMDPSRCEAFCAAELTTLGPKASAFSAEPLFRETLVELAASTGAVELPRLADLVRSTGLAMFRPDALHFGKVGAALAYLEGLGLRAHAPRPLRVTPLQAREVWRYQLNGATSLRLRLLDLLFAQGPSICFLFRDLEGRWPVPCSTVLADAKGEAEASAREGWELRSRLRSPSRMITFLHTADEPADVIRDGGLLLGPAGFAQAVGDLLSGTGDGSWDPFVSTGAGDERAVADVQAPSDASSAADAWTTLREPRPSFEMSLAQNVIGEPGTDGWWERAGLLEERLTLLRAAALSAGPGASVAPRPSPRALAAPVPNARPSVHGGELAALSRVLESGWWTGGSEVTGLEDDLRALTGAREAVVLSSGTAAVHALLECLGVGPGTLVVTSSLNFAAVASGARRLGAAVGLTDVREGLLNMDPASLDELLEAHVRDWDRVVVAPVHYAGRAADMRALCEVAQAHGADVVEDAAHVMGSRYAPDGPVVGSWPRSRGAAFSFHPNKPVAAGEGGAVLCEDPELARRLRRLRNHNMVRTAADLEPEDGPAGLLERGDPWYYEVRRAGVNLRLSDLLAAVARVQLSGQEATREARRRLARRYDEGVAGLPWARALPLEDGDVSSHHLYPVVLDLVSLGLTRRQVFDAAREQGIGLQVHYVPLHRQPFLADAASPPSGFPVLDRLSEGLLSLPLHADLTAAEQDRVVAFLHAVPGFVP